MTSEVVNEHLESSNLSAGNIYTKRKLDDFVSLLQSKYEESGYYAVKISQDIKLDNQNRIEIEFNSQSFLQQQVDLWNFWAEKISEKELLKLFKIGEADMVLVNYFTNKDDYNDSELRNGINLMTNTYFDSGYLDFKIVDVTSNLDDKKEKLSINIEISEGIQYKLGKVSFEGELANIPLYELNNAIVMNEGDAFNRNSIIQSIQSLTDMYADQGYAFVEINPITSEFLDSVNICVNVFIDDHTK